MIIKVRNISFTKFTLPLALIISGIIDVIICAEISCTTTMYVFTHNFKQWNRPQIKNGYPGSKNRVKNFKSKTTN